MAKNISPAAFVPSTPSVGIFGTDYIPSAEAQKLLSLLKARYGRDIKVEPIANAEESVSGYFRVGGLGGSFDPNQRTVYLNPGSSDLGVLAHELGHAFDPELAGATNAMFANTPARLRDLNKYGIETRNPVAFLNTYMTNPRSVFRSETEAQRASADLLDEIGVSTEEYRKTSDFKGYPQAYIKGGLDSAASIYSTPTNVPEAIGSRMAPAIRSMIFKGGVAPEYIPTRGELGDNTFYDIRDSVTQNMLDLALNEKYRRAEQSIQDQAEKYLTKKLTR